MDKGQLEVTFNWMYILIAGGVILLFFIGIVVRQSAVSEENIKMDISRTMESIFTGAALSENTKNFIGISQLKDLTLFFECSDEVSRYGIKGSSAIREELIQPVFSPNEIKSSGLILRSVSYEMPYKVIDLLLVSSSSNKYFIIGDDNTDFKEDLLKMADPNPEDKRTELNLVEVVSEEEIDPGANFQVRVIYLGPEPVPVEVPEKLKDMSAEKLSAIHFITPAKFQYYKPKNDFWQVSGPPVDVISLGGENDAARIAAVFAHDAQLYECNMKKAINRLKYINILYQKKLDGIKDAFKAYPASSCLIYLGNAQTTIGQQIASTLGCSLDTAGACIDLKEHAFKLRELNENLELECIPLY